ncbi:hypothetical protein QVD17_15373 [Tagetes erecta]|uniref:CUE domain-containing protein n=1 Tax=Tagetes erecta TaxID=13708 RepID=A0AAD8NZM2_TARER|nr:hypothetical protein QVD17_15373 [Tagetes erecta]
MAFNSVYRVLHELFPQVDSRVLKAVSLQHSDDVDEAAEVVLVEIIPSLSKQPLAVGSSSSSPSSPRFFDAVDGSKTGEVEATMDHINMNPFIAERSTNVPISSIDGNLLRATEVVEFVNLEQAAMSSDHDTNSETAVSCGGVPILMGTFGKSNHANADSDSPVLIREKNKFVGNSETNLVATQESDPSSSKALEKDDSAVNFVNSEDESATSSEQICSTGYLDEVIEDAKNSKKTLALAMDSVINFMKAVELKEQAADQAKEDATRGCSDVLAKVDEVKHALSRAKEANDMHYGEVNAEKAILGTEMRELQLRLFTLSDDTNKSLGILDEMHRGLEIRMAAAIEEIAAAEDMKLERERAAREALLYEEAQMEKVVEESKKLKLEAEENSKLQEFLMDRGQTIDTLQGEIAVKCQDVLLLKEKFDKRIPLSQSLFSSQASSILASSNSSFRITPPPFEPETETYETPKKSSELGDSYGMLHKSSRSDVSPDHSSTETAKSVIGDEEKVDERKLIIDDDGWELFDNGDFLVR